MRDTTNTLRRRMGAFPALASGLAILAFAPASAATLRPGDIIVVTGSTAHIIQVDPRTGSQALITSGGMLGRPVAVAIEASGSLLVVDGDRFGPRGPQIIRVDPVTGGQSIVSGGGILLDPHDIAIDSDGNLLIADFSAPAGLGGIVRVDAETGAQSVVFESPSPAFTPLSLALAAGGEIFYTRALGFFGTPLFQLDPGAGSASLVAPDVGSGKDIVIEASGEILVADGGTASGPSRVLRVDPRTGAVAVVSAAGMFQFLKGIAANAEGLIFVTDEAGAIIRVDPATGAQAFVSSGRAMVGLEGIAIVDCRFHFNPDRADGDGDGIGDFCDNCQVVPNPDQADSDSNGVGDACALCSPFQDDDGDDVCNDVDNCPLTRGPDQADSDGDGFGDACDSCNGPGQSDSDGDGLCDQADNCPLHINPDQADEDLDGIGNACDNCPVVPNPDQSNADGDARGDACDGDRWYVTSDGLDTNDCLTPVAPCATINAAIGKAAGGDTVYVATGTYTGTGEAVARLDRDVTLSGGWAPDFVSQPGRSVLDGETIRRGLIVSAGVTAKVERFVARNGWHFALGGGGVLNSGGVLVLDDSLIEYNRSGGIRSTGFGTVTVNRTIVHDNLGGGVDNSQGTLNLNHCDVIGNEGPGLVNQDGQVTLTFCTVSSNANRGIENDSGTVRLDRSTVEFNRGGIFNFTGVVRIDGSTIHGNDEPLGIGGVYNLSGNGRVGRVTLINSTISGNSSEGQGGGVFNSGALVAANSTISGNTARFGGGGIYLNYNPGFTSLTLMNSIVAGNLAVTGPDCAGGFQTYSSAGHNLLGTLQGCPILAAATDLLDIDPALGPLQDNGGPTPTHALLPDSPAIDAGNGDLPGSSGNACEVSDQRGIPRPQGPACDIGAFESGPAQPDTDGDDVRDGEDNCRFVSNPAQADGDGDGVGDSCDNCPSASNPSQTDRDRDQAGDACDDSDGDGVVDAGDNCPFIANPNQADTDGDAFGDACDTCHGSGQFDSDGDGVCDPADNCRFAFNPDQADGDGDGVGDACDNCPGMSNADQADSDHNGVGDACALCPRFEDFDGDNVCNDVDNCPLARNPNQADGDGDGVGDDCDACDGPGQFDCDGDGICDLADNCVCSFNRDQADGDSDGAGDACDNCPGVSNPDQADSDFNGVGDVCALCPPFEDYDGDNVCNDVDNCLVTRNPNQADGDGDGVGDVCDNCPSVPNPTQMDSDGDSVGDACENRAPVAEAGPEGPAECNLPAASSVTLEGSGSTDPDGDALSYLWTGDFPEGGGTVSGVRHTVTLSNGPHLILLTVNDGHGHTATDGVVITVVDTTPPELTATAAQTPLWPPNHRMVDVEIGLSASDVCGVPQLRLMSVTSNEPDDAEGIGDGNTTNDIQGAEIDAADNLIRLRAERDGTRNGRIYTLVYAAEDQSGNMSTAAVHYLVPHDQSAGIEPLNIKITNSGFGSVLSWNDAPNALFYSVVRGKLGNLTEADGFMDLGAVSCLEAHSQDRSTEGHEDSDVPALGEAFFYLVGYDNGWGFIGYGTESTTKPRVASSGDCAR